MYSSNRNDYRKVFFDTWRKYKSNEPLEPVESQLLELILLHPEYHAILENPIDNQEKNFDESNPFLHMSLHLGIREQLSTNRPAGIREIYQKLCNKFKDIHEAEHKMMEYLAKTLWDAQQSGKMPDETDYLEGLKKLK